MRQIFHRSSTFLDDYMHQFELMFRRTLPDLFEHMYAQGFSLPMFGIEWFTTMVRGSSLVAASLCVVIAHIML